MKDVAWLMVMTLLGRAEEYESYFASEVDKLLEEMGMS